MAAAPDRDQNYCPTPPCSEESFDESLNLSRGINSRIPDDLQLLLTETDPRQNLIVQSQSGASKTAALVLAMLTRVDASKPYPQVLCLLPTKESAQQTGSVLQQIAQLIHSQEIQFKLAVFGSERSDQNVTEHILIGTAGTTLDWAVKYRVFDPKLINMFVLDEGDVMIDTQGQQDQTIRLHRLLRTDCQHVLFRATYNEEVMIFASKHLPTLSVMICANKIITNPCLMKQYYVWCIGGNKKKYKALTNIYGVLTIGQCIVFCHTTESAEWLAKKMTRNNHAVALLTDKSSTVEKRNGVLISFRNGMARTLITTATDINTDQVTLVVNYDIPVDVNHKPDYETYLHRIGRSGRFGKSGLAISFVDSGEAYVKLMSINDYSKSDITELNAKDSDEIEKLQN